MGDVTLIHGDCLEVMPTLPAQSVQSVIADPPFVHHEFSSNSLLKLRSKNGGIWRQPRKGRSAVPRFTFATNVAQTALFNFLQRCAKESFRLCVPGAHAFIACTPSYAHHVTNAFVAEGWEIRTTLIRLVQTLRGGDRPKNGHKEFPDVSVLPRSQYEPWVLFRKPLEGTCVNNLRSHRTGALKRISSKKPFGDVILSSRTRKNEKLWGHPTQKPVAFLHHLLSACSPFEGGTVLDFCAGSGTTAIAAMRTGRNAICIEKDATYFAAMQKRVADERARMHQSQVVL